MTRLLSLQAKHAAKLHSVHHHWLLGQAGVAL